MKRLSAIFLISLFSLSIIGYYGAFVGIQYRIDSTMKLALDANTYDDSQTFRIAIPVSVPYMADDADFQRVDGKFEHNGEHFRLVKQKYSRDTLTVVCVRDVETKEINRALAGYLSSFTDQPTEQGGTVKIPMTFSKDYISQNVSVSAGAIGWELTLDNFRNGNDLIPSFCVSFIHPPERV